MSTSGSKLRNYVPVLCFLAAAACPIVAALLPGGSFWVNFWYRGIFTDRVAGGDDWFRQILFEFFDRPSTRDSLEWLNVANPKLWMFSALLVTVGLAVRSRQRRAEELAGAGRDAGKPSKPRG